MEIDLAEPGGKRCSPGGFRENDEMTKRLEAEMAIYSRHHL